MKIYYYLNQLNDYFFSYLLLKEEEEIKNEITGLEEKKITGLKEEFEFMKGENFFLI